MAEEALTPTSTQCSFVKRGGIICVRAKKANKAFCKRCTDLMRRRSEIPRYNTPNSIEPPTKMPTSTPSAIANAQTLAALPTDSVALSPELNKRLSTIEAALIDIKESIEDLNNKLDSEIYHRKRGLAICYSKLGIQMPHRMRHESPPSFIVNPIGDIPDSPNHINLPAPNSPKPKVGKRQQKAASKQQKKGKQ